MATAVRRHLPATVSATMWGPLPCAEDELALTVDSGEQMSVDTVSHEGILEGQGRDPVTLFAACGVPATEALADAIEGAKGAKHTAEYGPHVVTGPIGVRGTDAGDYLAVRVDELLPRTTYGVISSRHGKGLLPCSFPVGPKLTSIFCAVLGLDGAAGSTRATLPVSDGSAAVLVRFPIAPFLGVMGVATPDATRLRSTPPGEHGGNIDIRLVREASTLCLPVQVPDAGFVGDPHLAQGNCEIALPALEAPLCVTTIDVIPRAQVRETFGSARRPHQAVRLRPGEGKRMVMTVPEGAEVLAPSEPPAGLLQAFWRYDAALLSNDRHTLNELFMPGPDTLRGDGRTVLVGHDAIAGFRSSRTVVPTRKVVQLHVQVIADDAALLMARTVDGNTTGLQTQLWRRAGDRWVVAAAHVTQPTATAAPPARPMDTTVWRVAGDPLVPPRSAGPLDGLGVAVKDLFAVAGQPIGAGVPGWLVEQQPQVETAPAVVALLAAGAHVVGIARTDEFAYSLAGTNAHHGTPPNPAAPGCISGGSSSGPASAVALGQAAIGLGTDTAGSIRVPASYQGLVGVRTTHGAISTQKMLPLAPSFDTVGWLTKDVLTSALVAGALLPSAVASPDVGRTLRVPGVEALARADLRDAFASTLSQLTEAGILPPAQTVDLPTELLERWFHAFRTVQAWEAWQAHGVWLTRHPGVLGEDVAERFEQAAQVSGEQAEAARAVVGEARERLADWLRGSVLAIPSASSPALPRNATPSAIETERGRTLRMTCLAGLAGAPAVSLPRLRSDEGHPAGLCLIGEPGTDRGLLDIAARVEVTA